MLDPSFNPLNTLTGAPLASQFVATSFIGPPFAGWILSLLLFGLVAANFGNYLDTGVYQNDSTRTKAFLWLVVGLNAASVAINCYETFHYGTSQKRDADTLFMVLPIDAVPSLLIGLIGALVQTYLLMRAARLFAHQRIVKATFVSSIGFLIVVGVIGSCGSATMNLLYTKNKESIALPFTYNNVTGTYLWICAFIDVSITAALVFCLRKHIAGFNESTDGLLRRLMNLGMRTAAYTSVYSVFGAIVATSFSQNNVPTENLLFAFTFPLSSLYTLSLISTLASRNMLARHATPSRLPGVSRAGETFSATRYKGHIPSIAASIYVERESISVVQVNIDDTEVLHRSVSGELTGLDGGLKRPEATLWV